MPLALRPYATAGIALVGAGVIAVTPVAAPPPEIQSHSVQLTAAVDNPVDVFTPVFEKAAAFIQTTIANETANPLPIANAVIAKGTADAQTLGEIAEALAPVVKAVILNFPPTAAAALQKAAAGDLDGAMSTFVPLFIGPVIGGFQQYMKLTDLVRGEFEVVARLAEATMYQAWGTALGTALAGFTVATTTAAGIEAVGTAIVSGDPANVVNAAQHSVANIASAGISAVDTTINLNVALARQAFAKAINPPPPEPEEPLTVATAEPLSLPAATPAVEKVSAATAPATTGTPAAVAAATDEPSKTPPPESDRETTKPLVRDSAIAVPGTPGVKGSAGERSTKPVTALGERVSAAVNKIGEGIKKAFARPTSKTSSTTESSADSGTGASGDAE